MMSEFISIKESFFFKIEQAFLDIKHSQIFEKCRLHSQIQAIFQTLSDI